MSPPACTCPDVATSAVLARDAPPASPDKFSSTHVVVLLFHSMLAVAVFGSLGRLARAEYSRAREHRGVSVQNYIMYRLDFFLSTWTMAKSLIVLLSTYTLVMTGALLYSVFANYPFIESIWVAWLMLVDSSRHGSERGPTLRALSMLITLGGMLLFALMIGLISDAVVRMLDSLKEGRSQVVEEDHTVILGWGDTTLQIVRQICLANESEGGRVICVMADFPKHEMERDLRDKLPQEALLGSTVVVRSGMPVMAKDLRRVATAASRAVIVLADARLTPDKSDAQVLRTVMCLRQIRTPESKFHVVAELRDADNRDLITVADKTHTTVVVSHDIIGRVMLQSSRQPSLSRVVSEVLGFEGNEFYVKEFPELQGATFGEVAFRFAQAVPLGLKLREQNGKPGGLVLNPRFDYVLKPGDGVVVLAEDDDSYQPAPLTGFAKAACESVGPLTPLVIPKSVESFLLCGFRRNLEDLILELDDLASPGTTVTLMCALTEEERVRRFQQGGLDVQALSNLQLRHVVGNPAVRRDFDDVDLASFTSILILADEKFEADSTSADSMTLANLLLINDTLCKQKLSGYSFRSSSFRGLSTQDVSTSPPKLFLDRAGKSASFVSLADMGKSSSEEDLRGLTPSIMGMPPRPPPVALDQTSQPGKRNSRFQSLVRRFSTTPDEHVTPSPTKLAAAGAADDSSSARGPTILTEFLDSRTKALVQVSSTSPNFVMSNEVVAQILAMLAEDVQVNQIFAELLHAGGSALHMREAYPSYLSDLEPSFWHMAARGQERAEIVLGYLSKDQLVLNPPDKDAKVPRDAQLRLVVMSKV